MEIQPDTNAFRTRNRLLLAVGIAVLFLGFPDRKSPELTYRRALAEMETLQTIRYDDYARFCVKLLQIEKANDRLIDKEVRSRVEGKLKHSIIAPSFYFGYAYVCPFHKSGLTIKSFIQELDSLNVEFVRLGPAYDWDFVAKLLVDYDSTNMEFRRGAFLTAREMGRKSGVQFGGVEPAFEKPAINEIWLDVDEPKDHLKLPEYGDEAVILGEYPSRLGPFMLRIFFSLDSVSSHWIHFDVKPQDLSRWSVASRFPTLFYNERFHNDPSGEFKSTWSLDGTPFPDSRAVLNLIGDLQPENAAAVLREKLAGSERQIEFLNLKFAERYATYFIPLVLSFLTLLFWIDAKKSSAEKILASQEELLRPLGRRGALVTTLFASVLLPISALIFLAYRNWVLDGLSLTFIAPVGGLMAVIVFSAMGSHAIISKVAVSGGEA